MEAQAENRPKTYFPAFLDLTGRIAVVVGGGDVAARKVVGLLAAGARVRVVAPELDRSLEAMVSVERVEVVRREYRAGDLEGAFVVVAAASDPEVNRAVAAEAVERNLLINVVDLPELCSFIVPSVIRRDELTVAISTGGMSPAMAKQVRQKLEEVLVPEYGPFLRLLGSLRPRIRRELPVPAQREAFWAEAVGSNVFQLFRSKGESAVLARLEEILRRVQEGRPCRLMAVGLNHRTAPVELRERLAPGGDGVAALLDRLAGVAGERIVLATCNRMEVYVVPRGEKDIDGEVRALLHGLFCLELDEAELASHLYTLRDEEAARHLFSVAAGIDSMVLGETQILGQVRDALDLAAARGAVGSMLSALFQRALAAGKRARTETAISRSAVSVSHAAVELARGVVGDLASSTVLLVGAGEMGELAARNLTDNGAGALLVVNRSWDKAEELANRYGGVAVPWDDIGAALERADIVISSTASPVPVIEPGLVRPAMVRRRGRPLMIVDIAVPRDVDPAVGSIEGVHLYDIDDLQSVVKGNLKEREREVAAVEAIVQEEVAAFSSWLRCQEVVPTLVALRERLERIRRDEVERCCRRLRLDEKQRNAVEAMAQAIVNKVLHSPTVRLKEQAQDGACGLYVDAVRELFDLD